MDELEHLYFELVRSGIGGSINKGAIGIGVYAFIRGLVQGRIVGVDVVVGGRIGTSPSKRVFGTDVAVVIGGCYGVCVIGDDDDVVFGVGDSATGVIDVSMGSGCWICMSGCRWSWCCRRGCGRWFHRYRYHWQRGRKTCWRICFRGYRRS